MLEALGAQGIFDFGEEPGAAVQVKLAGNFLLVSAACSMVEACGMLHNAGVDAPAAVEMLTQTLFPAPIYRNYGKLVAEGRPPFSQRAIPIKDVGLFEQRARQVGSATPLADAVLHVLQSTPQ